MKTAKQRYLEQREAKLERIRQQIESGRLVVRQMTRAERAKYPPRSAKTKSS
jgi:anti-sigma28 factor (negative regulator of flagellin synthesis)